MSLRVCNMHIFFFQCNRHHRDLHSFPTRRSSDLITTYNAWDGWNLVQEYHKSGNNTVEDASYLYGVTGMVRSEEHTSELQSRGHLVCRLLLEKKNKTNS